MPKFISAEEAYYKYGLHVFENWLISVEYICRRRGYPVYLEEIEDGFNHWCVFFTGRGNYFQTREAAERFMKDREFIRVRTPKRLSNTP